MSSIFQMTRFIQAYIHRPNLSFSLSLSLSQQEQFREYIEANGTRQEAAAWLMGLSRNKQKEATLGKKKNTVQIGSTWNKMGLERL